MSQGDLGLGDNELTVEEKGWSFQLQLKAQKEGVTIDNTFMLHAFALLGKGDINKAFKRAKHFDEICKEWGVRETSRADSTAWMKKLSSGGCFLPSGVTPDGMPIQGNRPAAFDPATVKTDEDWRMLIHGLIDNMRAITPTLRDVRRGSAIVAWLKGFGWKNIDLKVEKRMSAVAQNAYPVKLKKLYVVDPPLIFRAVLRVFSVFMKQKIIDRLRTVTADEMAAGDVLPLEQVPTALGGNLAEDFIATRARRLKRQDASISELGALVPIPGV